MATSHSTLTQSELHRHLSYDPETGVFIWRSLTSNRVPIDSIAGTLRRDGYRSIRISGRIYLAHRLAWFYVHGVWPENELDHSNHDPSDNRLANLRVANKSQNMFNRGKQRNNTSGHKGVSWLANIRKWNARITVNGKTANLGYFSTLEAAAEAYATAVREHHGDFAHL